MDSKYTNSSALKSARIDFNRTKIEAAWRIMISRQWGIESTKVDSARGSTVASAAQSARGRLAWSPRRSGATAEP
jgi:hypothetical protein